MPQLNLRALELAIRNLSRLVPERTKIFKNKEKKGPKKTQKGATHIINPVFRSKRQHKLTPAQYRHQHAANPHKAAVTMAKKDKKHAKFSV